MALVVQAHTTITFAKALMLQERVAVHLALDAPEQQRAAV